MSPHPEDGPVAAAGELLAAAVFRAADLVYGPWTIAVLLGVAVFLTVRLRFVQVTRLRDVLPQIREMNKDPLLYQHLETVGNEYASYFKSKSGDGYDAFLKRIKG